MVFESLVVELINRFLGDFVENLDTSQLKIGIWGGDVVLNNLNLKESALDDLDLPVKIRAGHIGKLVLKIPWKNLYTEAVVAEIDGIYALALPNIGIKYNAEKEELAKQEAKQKKLLQIEKAKEIKAQQGQPKEEQKDTFAEKLVTQVIKNLQVKVSNIHIRYEDRYSNPKRPFAIGLSLQELLFQTTDDNWKPSIIKEAVTQIYKLVRLDCLSVYWNSNAELLDGLEREQILETMKCNIAGPGFKTGYQYVVRPISAVAHLRLHTKPEQSKFTVPKIGLTVVFDEIAVGLTKDQYDNLLEMLESMERMNLMSLHRKYRPDVNIEGNAKKWWLYAFFCVMDDTVRRRRDMWSWNHMAHHRLVMKRYREAYVHKLDSKKIGADVQKVIDDSEKYLDVFCITLMRQQAEMLAAKIGAQRKEEARGGWFGGMFGGGGSRNKDSVRAASEEMQNKFYQLYTGEEKAKLYSAIGYEENEADLTLPVEYCAVRVVTKLRSMTVFLRDTRQKVNQLLKLQLKDVYSSFGQRPAANAILLEAKVDKMIVSGCPQADFIPKMITSQVQEKEQVNSLLTLAVETNPLDGSCDTSIKVKARPLEIVYDAVTINRLSVFFRPPKSVELKQFSQAAMARFDEIKEQSSAGIQHAIESHKYTSINVHLMSSYVIVPEGGIMRENVKMLVLDLGHLKVTSEKHDVAAFNKESMEDKIAKAYDKLNISLRNIQLLFVQPGEAWQAARDLGESSMHILNPVTLSVDVRQCILDRDPRFPKMKVLGELPSIQVNLSDTAFHNVLALVTSIPLPESPPVVGEEEDHYKYMVPLPKTERATKKILSTAAVLGDNSTTNLLSKEGSLDPPRRTGVAAEKVNFLDMELIFEIKQIMVGISRTLHGRERPYLNLAVNRLGTSIKMRTFDMTVNAYISSISLQQLEYRLTAPVISQLKMVGASANEVIHIINTPVSTKPDCHLLTVTYLQANKKAPDFHTTYRSTEQSISIQFRSLELLLHQDSILSLMDFANRMAPPAAPKHAAAASMKLDVSGAARRMSRALSTANLTPKRIGRKVTTAKQVQVIDINVEADLCQFSVGICNERQLITHLQVKGIQAAVTMMKEKMVVSAVLQDLVIFDPDPDTLHQKILRIEGSEVLNANIVLFNDGTSGNKYSDLSCVDTSVAAEIGCIKVVFVNKFVNSLLDFVNNFTEAQEKIAKAGQAAAQAGLEAVQSLQETAARLKLSVRMKAPVILVPQSSKSFNSLMLDLGLLMVGNRFEMAGAMSPAGVPAVLEHMKVELTDLKLSRALIQADGSVKSERIVLEPVSFTLLMQRNLSGAWYHDHPDIQIGGALEQLTAHLSQGDYATVMQVLNENLNEGVVIAPPPKTHRPSHIGDARIEGKKQLRRSDSELSFDTQVLSAVEPEKFKKAPVSRVIEESDSSMEAYTSIKVDFQLKGLCAFFYTGDTVLSSGRKSHDPARILGKFELQLLSVVASIMSNKAISAIVTLNDTIVDDMRVAKQTGITRMIERSKTLSAESATMIAVDYSANSKGDKKVRLGISSLYICVCVEFLMTLANFFTQGLTASLPPEVEFPAAASVVSTGEGDAPTQTETSQGSMDIVLDMDKPEIILIEDQLNFDTKALVVDLMLSFRLRQMPEEQIMSAGITKMEIFSCTFSDRTNQLTQVLMPCDITLHSNAKYGKNPHMAVSLTDMVLNISASTIETMSTIAAGMSIQTEAPNAGKRDYAPDGLWQKKKISDCKFWFLSQAMGSDVDEVMPDMRLDLPAPVGDREEELILTLPSLVVKMEGGVGHRTIPLLIVESCLQAQVRNWSGQLSDCCVVKLSVEAELDLEVGYYNERLAVWEPLIEPVLHENKFRRWKLNLEVRQNVNVHSQLEDSLLEEVEDQVVVLPSKMVVNVSSVDALQVCFTKTCLEVLTNLGMSFNDAYNLVKKTGKKEETVFAPYVFGNQTGYEIILKLDPSFEMPASAVQGKSKLGAGAVLPVYSKVEAVSTKTKASMIKATQEGDERKIIFQVEQFNATREVTIKRAEKRLFQINQRTNDGDVWAVICHTECTIGQKFITLQSILSVRNELTFPVEVFFRGTTQLESCGIVEPEGTLSLPLNVVYCLSNDLFFKPVSNKYNVSEKPINWRTLEKDGAQQVSCPTVSAGHSPCYFCVFPEVESVYFELGDEKTAKCYILSLEPSVLLHNLLPFAIKYMLEGTEEEDVLELGQNQPLMHASISEANLAIEIPSYKGMEWLANRKLQKNMPELTVIQFSTRKGTDKIIMEMGLHCKMNKASLDVTIYSPYWLLNKTGRMLYYRGSDQDATVENNPEEGQLTLFSFLGKSGRRKDKEEEKGIGDKNKKEKVREMKQAGKAQLKIDDLDWSDKFSLDTVGSSGTVACKSKVKDTTGAEVGVAIHLSSSGLTKIVTFTPFYMFLNTALDTILVSEADRENWVEIPPGQCQPYWPQISGKDVDVKAKVRDTNEQTGPFPINKAHFSLLRLDNKYGGINAECQVSEASMITTLQTYKPGMATVTVINHTHESTITFYQSGEQQQQTVTLQKQEVILYTWDNALGKRELVWSCGKKKDVKNDLTQDGMDEFFADDDTKIYWVSILDGLQRILLFTEDLAVAANAKEALQAGEMDQIDQEINLEIQGLGLSLVDNIRQVEVAFLGITSSGIIWEERRKRRYKALKLKDCLMLEAAWQKYQMELAVGKIPNSRILLENKMELDLKEKTLTIARIEMHRDSNLGMSPAMVSKKVDFVDMTVVRPKTFPIRRSFENGIWLQYKTSPHQVQVHAKINRMQLDNQLRHAVFPTVLSPLPPPKSVAAESVPKPFMELSIMLYTHEHSSISQFKYFKVLVQEMNVKVDQGFLNALLELFSPANSLPREQETIQFKQDLLTTEKTLMMVAGLSLAEEQKNFYDYLHFSPIKIHLSFSLQSGSDDGNPTELHSGVLNVFLQSVGVVLTDIQDVVFKLGYFERSHTFYNQSQLNNQMIRHYAGQAIKQMYVLVLGLDVLGNPFGLLRGLSEGIEDLFYEPYQGAIQGPEEFAEGLALGVRSLFGHAVGGAAGAVSRITGTLGKGMATLTLDDDYQKQRREAMTKKPATAREGFARGGKGFVMGVFDGVTGIVRKPVEGAKQEGVTGFFKGMGKGLVGVVTRPTSGMIDFASSSFEGIRRITDIYEEIRRLRPPRRFFKDKVVRPYNHQEAEGYGILSEIDKGQYITSDEYKAHVVLTKDGKSVLVVTDKRVLMAKRGDLFGAWDAEWMFVWVDLQEDTPHITNKGIEITLKVKEKKFFSTGSAKKEVHIPDPKVAEWIAGKIHEQILRLKS